VSIVEITNYVIPKISKDPVVIFSTTSSNNLPTESRGNLEQYQSCTPVCRLRLEHRFLQYKEETPLLNRSIRLLHGNVTRFIFFFANHVEISLNVICIRSTAVTIRKFASCISPPVLQAEIFIRNLFKTWCQ
jgi:hypothetical protein